MVREGALDRAASVFNVLVFQTNLTRQTETNLSRLSRSEVVRGEMRPALWSVETTTWGAYFTGTK
jgi:hypothetical protein